MSVVREQEIARYVDRVRQALADLSPQVRDELLEDLPDHLAEVAAENPGSLNALLGPPEVYAVELRAAAGLGPRRTRPNLDDRINAGVTKVRGWLETVDVKTGPVIGYDKASDFLRLLRPAWWVLRGYLAAMFIAYVFFGSSGWIPDIDGSNIAGMLLVAAAVIASIWLGRRSHGFSRWPRLAVIAGSALTALFGLVMLANASYITNRYYGPYEQTTYFDPYGHVQDVYVYDSEGRLLEGVRLLDQNGSPIHLGNPWCERAGHLGEARAATADGRSYTEPTEGVYPYCPEQAPFRFNGRLATVPPTPSADPTSVPSAGPTPTDQDRNATATPTPSTS